jgi:hypothetical protein
MTSTGARQDGQVTVPLSANQERIIPEGLDWQVLLRSRGDHLETQYTHILTELGKRTGTLGRIFQKVTE